jgi:glycosyltransferase involved in cell wall biosynthesis
MRIERPAVAADSLSGGLRIAMALYGDVTHDSRVMREAETLTGAGHAVTIYCLSGSAPSDAPFRVVAHTPRSSSVLPDGSSPFLSTASHSTARRLAARVRWMVGYARTLRSWGRWVVRAAGPVDVWHAHDLTGLVAVARLLRAPTRLVYDSHEIFLETGTGARLPRLLRRLISAYEARLTRGAVALITVNEGCAEVLQRRLRPRRTIVVRNCPPRWTPPGDPASTLRDAAGIPSGQPAILYHGAFMANRGIEELAEATLRPGLDSGHLALLGYGPARERLDALARDPRFDGRVHVLDAVSPQELLGWVAGADVDVMPIQRSTLNHWLGTPNRLWESLAAGVPVVASDFPVMHRVVLEDPAGPLGAVCDPSSPDSIAAALRSILELPAPERAALRERCLQAAHERWNWETEGARLLELYAGLTVRAGTAVNPPAPGS